jgi:transposase
MSQPDRSLPPAGEPIVGGVDTHKMTHTAAALTATGRLLGTAQFPATPQGYRELLAWLRAFGPVGVVGLEGSGSYGAGLCRALRAAHVPVLEVLRPKRQVRRRHGKSDPADAIAAARTVLAGEAAGPAKAQDGAVEALRLLLLTRRSALKARTQAANQLHAIVDTAPAALRATLSPLSLPQLVATARRFRCGGGAPTTPLAAARWTLKVLADRWLTLSTELERLTRHLATLVQAVAPHLLAAPGVGPDTAATLVVAAGDNPTRLATEAAFAALCGVSPVDASSGRQHRHRLNRGGNREANRALWVITRCRLRHDPTTRAYVARRTQQGLSKPEIIRCLKRYLARAVFQLLRADHLAAGEVERHGDGEGQVEYAPVA